MPASASCLASMAAVETTEAASVADDALGRPPIGSICELKMAVGLRGPWWGITEEKGAIFCCYGLVYGDLFLLLRLVSDIWELADGHELLYLFLSLKSILSQRLSFGCYGVVKKLFQTCQ